MDKYFDIIQKKHNYDDQFMIILKAILENMINYYGEEYTDKILSTFIDTPIEFVSSNEKILEFTKSLGIKKDYTIPQMAKAGFEEYFQLDDDGNIQRIPFILVRFSQSEDDKVKQLGILVHEMCHAVMNYGKSTIEENKIICRTGIIEEEIDITPDGLKDKREFIHGKNVQIEEGFNEYDARCITRMITGQVNKADAYGANVSYVAPLMNNPETRKIIDNSRLNGTDEWKEILGEELTQEYIDSFTDWVKNLLSFSTPDEVKNQKKKEMQKTYYKVKEYIDNTYSNKKRA